MVVGVRLEGYELLDNGLLLVELLFVEIIGRDLVLVFKYKNL